MSEKYALEFRNVRKCFGNFEAVRGLTFEIKEGEIFALLGPNGAGKSTSINMIVGLNKITSGDILVYGWNTKEEPYKTRGMTGVMHQEVVAETFLPVAESLELHGGYYGAPVDKAWLEELLSRLALDEHRNKRSGQLSGGMKRRLMMAKALIHKPKLLILDEPTAGVDVELRQIIWEFVKELNREEKTTVLLTTHYIEEAEKICERIAIVDGGKLVALDTAEALISAGNSKNLEEVFLKLTQTEGPRRG